MDDSKTHLLRRRQFLDGMGLASASAASLAAGAGLSGLALPAVAWSGAQNNEANRLDRSLKLRIESARRASRTPAAPSVSNGDEERHPSWIACYSKGLPHDERGFVNPAAYKALLKAVQYHEPGDFDAIPVGSIHMPLVNPQGGLCLGLAGLDVCQFSMPPAPAFSSAERAGELIECHWMALTRDIPFAEYTSHPLVRAACDELTGLSDFRGPKQNGQVTPSMAFRGNAPGDLVGPYISQFLLQPIKLGAIPVNHQIVTYLPIEQGGADYLTDFDSWLSVQNGDMPMGELRRDPVARHIRTARDLCAYVHTDYTYQAFFNASVWLANHSAPVNPGSPYPLRRNQTGFVTFGVPDAQGMLALAHLCALRAVWYQKWVVHRAPRPEEFGGRVHATLSGKADDPIHSELKYSQSLRRTFEKTRSYLLPQAFPEGSPQHPSYGQGHAVCAGACVTVLKAFYDGSTRLLQLGDVYESSPDGRKLLPFRSPEAGQMTVAGELDKLAGNIGVGRNMAGIHWRSDYWQAMLLGEAVAIDLLKEYRQTYSESTARPQLQKFDGSVVTI